MQPQLVASNRRWSGSQTQTPPPATPKPEPIRARQQQVRQLTGAAIAEQRKAIAPKMPAAAGAAVGAGTAQPPRFCDSGEVAAFDVRLDQDPLPGELTAFGISEQLKQGLGALFRSHPPLDDRIRALQAG